MTVMHAEPAAAQRSDASDRAPHVDAGVRRGASASTSTTLSRRVRVREARRGDAARRRVVHARGRRARRDRRSQRRRQDNAAGGDRRHRPGDLGVGALRRHRPATPTWGRSAACSATCPRTTSSTPTCRSNARFATRRGCGSRRRRPRPRSTTRSATPSTPSGLTESGRRPGRLAERRAAQAGQHRRRAAHRSARLLPRRADVGPRPGHERGADRPPAPTRRPVGDGRVHHALGRGPRPVRSHRVHDAGRASGLRRHRRRGARAVRGRLGPGALPPPGRPGRHHLRRRHRPSTVAAPDADPPRREQATSGERAHAMACPHPPDARDIRAQPLDARDPGRVTGAGRRHVRHPLPARRVRLPRTRARARW